MKNSIIITNNDKLESLISLVNTVAPFLVRNMYKYMQQEQIALWSDHCNDQDENAAAFMIEMLKDSIQASLPQSIINEIDSRLSLALEYQVQAQFLALDIDEQNDQESFWNRSDEQAAFDDRLNMYANEY